MIINFLLTKPVIEKETVSRKIIRELKKARYSIWLANIWFTDNEIYELLIEKLREGLNVEIVLNSNNWTIYENSSIQKLLTDSQYLTTEMKKKSKRNLTLNEADPAVPKADEKYLQFMEDCIVEAATKAFENAQDAKLGLAIADDTGVGTNRRDPAGPADHQVPVLMVKSADGQKNITCMLICSMHPTVMHEDSSLISGDFPGLSKKYLQENVLGKDCPVLHHTGPAGNQSPRHVTKANTFEEADRLGQILGKAVEKAIGQIEYIDKVDLKTTQQFVELPKRSFPSVEKAEAHLEKAIQTLE